MRESGVFMNNGRWELLLKHSAIIICVSLLAGCMNQKTDSVSADIDFWSFPNFTSETGVQGDFEKELIAAFEKENPSINVRFTSLSYAEGADKIEQAISSH